MQRNNFKKPKTTETGVIQKEVYRCPSCGHCLPVHNLKGEVIVFCRYCQSNVRVTMRPTESDNRVKQDSSKESDMN